MPIKAPGTLTNVHGRYGRNATLYRGQGEFLLVQADYLGFSPFASGGGQHQWSGFVLGRMKDGPPKLYSFSMSAVSDYGGVYAYGHAEATTAQIANLKELGYIK